MSPDDLTPEGAEMFNQVNAAVATMHVEQAMAFGTKARALDVVLCDPDVRARYAVVMVNAEARAKFRPKSPTLRKIEGGAVASGKPTPKPALRVLPGEGRRQQPSTSTPPEVA